MKYILPVPITETSFLDSNAGALVTPPTTELVYPLWVPRSKVAQGQSRQYSGTVYKALTSHSGRSVTPNNDPRNWRVDTADPTIETWSTSDSWVEGDRVAYDVTHRLYQSNGTHSSDVPPNLDPTNWTDIGPTNPWAMFDRSVGSRTGAASPLTWRIKPGIVDSLVLLNVDGATSVNIKMYDGVTLVFDHTEAMGDIADIIDWYDYFFADFIIKSDLVIYNLPQYANAEIEITVAGSGDVGVGVCAVGRAVTLAGVNYGARAGITDYSLKEKDDFGNTNIVERTFSKWLEFDVTVDNATLDYHTEKLETLRATPLIWVDESGFRALLIYGFYKDWTLNFTHLEVSDISIEIEGLT